MLFACLWASAATPLDPDQLVRAVLSAHPEVVAADAETIAAERREHAVSGWMPLKAQLMVAPMSGMPAAEVSQMTMPLGEAGAERRMRAADTRMAQADGRMTRLGLAVRAATLWADWYDQHAQADLIDAGIATLGQLESSARERYARGLGSLSDARMAAEELAMLKVDRAMLQGDLDETRIGINSLLGQPLEAAVDRPAEPPTGTLPATLDAPEIAEAQAGVAEAEAGVAMARKQRLPAVGWMLSWEASDMGPADGLMVGGMVEVPLDQGVKAAAVSAAEADRQRAEARVDATTREAARAFAQARAMVAAQRTVLDTLEREVLPASVASVSAARTAYEAGHDNAQMLLMALHREHDVHIEIARARAELYKRQAMAWMAAGTLPPAWEGAP